MQYTEFSKYARARSMKLDCIKCRMIVTHFASQLEVYSVISQISIRCKGK